VVANRAAEKPHRVFSIIDFRKGTKCKITSPVLIGPIYAEIIPRYTFAGYVYFILCYYARLCEQAQSKCFTYIINDEEM